MTIPRSTSRPTSDAGPGWDPNRSHVRVVLRDVQTQAHVGLHPWERFPQRPTRLLVTVEMLQATPGPADRHGRAGIMDYDTVRDAIASWPGRPHVDLLETLAEELVAVCFSMDPVDACRVEVAKPNVFNEAAAVAVEIFRVRAR